VLHCKFARFRLNFAGQVVYPNNKDTCEEYVLLLWLYISGWCIHFCIYVHTTSLYFYICISGWSTYTYSDYICSAFDWATAGLNAIVLAKGNFRTVGLIEIGPRQWNPCVVQSTAVFRGRFQKIELIALSSLNKTLFLKARPKSAH
jgi:hypothetical protein